MNQSNISQSNSKIIFFFLAVLLLSSSHSDLKAQVFAEKQTRHRFAQLTFGYERMNSIGGQSAFSNNNQLNDFNLNTRTTNRLTVGGTHFWGHADIYLAVYTFKNKGGITETDQYRSSHSTGIETVFKYYPWRIKHNKLRPFIGTGIVPYLYDQNDKTLEFGNARTRGFYRAPLITGFTFNHKMHLLNVSLFYNYDSKIDYFINRTQQIKVKTPPLYLSFGYKLFIDTTIGNEKDWESGAVQKQTKEWEAKGKLSGFFIGIGPSTGYGLGKSSYNIKNRPYLDSFDAGGIWDIAAGYFWHQPNLNFNISWRKYRTAGSGFGAFQSVKRNSFAFEVSRGLTDFHGFVPILGPVISYEILNARETLEGVETFNVQEKKLSYGIVFGWDIRPTHKDWWYLRTNLRYFPNLKINVKDGLDLSAGILEFNFIQLVLYPKRMFK